jgi:hypothetical protein
LFVTAIVAEGFTRFSVSERKVIARSSLMFVGSVSYGDG